MDTLAEEAKKVVEKVKPQVGEAMARLKSTVVPQAEEAKRVLASFVEYVEQVPQSPGPSQS